jgi:hypothetical protein
MAGIRGAPLRAVGRAGLFAIVSERGEVGGQATEDDLWAHEAVVEALMDRGTVLPVRLGTLMSDDPAVLRALDARRGQLEAALERVRGAVELGIRAAIAGANGHGAGPEDAGGANGPGTAYMRARLHSERRGSRAAARIHQPLASLARDSTVRWSAQEPPLIRAAYLVDRDRIEAFMARVEELDALDEAAIVCTGPWPPYSFSSTEA